MKMKSAEQRYPGTLLFSRLALETSRTNVIKIPEIGRTSEDQITGVDLTGVAFQDIQVAECVL